MNRKLKPSFKPSPNFQVFYKIYAKRKLGAIATSIIMTLSFLQLNIFLFQSFLALTESEGDFIQAVNDVTSYFYTTNIINEGTSYYIALRYVLFAVSILYFLLFLGMRWTVIHNKPIKSLEQLFDFLNLYYSTLILLPTTEMAYREIVCDELVMSRLDQKCAQGIHIFVQIMAVLGFLSALIMSVITVFYSLNGIYDKKNYMSGENRFWEGIVSAVKISVAIIMANDSNSRTFLLTYLTVQLVFSLILLLYFLFSYPYNKIVTENALLFWLSFYFSQALSFLVYILIDNESLTSGYIFVFVVVICTPSLFYLYRRLKLRLLNKQTSVSIRDFLLKVQQLLQLKQVEKVNTFEEMEFRGIIARHISGCVHSKCFCKDTELFDPKKNRYVELDKWHYNKSLMLKYYVRALFEESVKSNPLHPDLLISYAEFLFEKFRNTHLALYQIMKVAQSNKFLHPYHRFKIYKLKYKISEYINVQNAEALDRTLEIESVIFVEEQLDRVINGMKEIITNSIGFWSYLVNKDLDLDKLGVLVQKMNNSVESTEKLWIPLKAYLRKQKGLMYFYNWFLKDFLHKRIILSEEEIDELFDNETFSVYSNEFLHILRDDNIIFQDESAIIHMSGNSNDLGKIIKTNRNAAKMFRYTQDELERSHVNALMPKIIAEKHNSYLESYIHTGKGKVLYDQRKTFAKDRDGYIMPIWLVVKQLDNPEGLVQYAGLIRPLSQKKEEQSYYILLNNFGEINGISRNLAEHLKLPGDVFHRKLVNIVLLAPKLIKYLYFARLLQDEKEKRVNESEEIDAMLINQTKDTKKETKLSQLVRRNDKSPFMTSTNKVSTLKEFIDLDSLKIDGIINTINKIDGEKSPRDEEGLKEEINQDFHNKEIEFTLRLPQKLNHFMKQFHHLKTKKHDLLNNQQLIISAIESKGLLKKAIEQSETNQKAKMPLFFQGRKKIAMHLASYKHAVDSYVEALRTVSNSIARSNRNNVYRIKGVIVSDHYGPEKDIVKYIKIKEIVKKQEKFSNYQYYGSEKNIAASPKGGPKDSSSSFLGNLLDKNSPSKSKFFNFKQDASKTIKASPFKNSNVKDSKAVDDEEKNQINSDNEIPKEGDNGGESPVTEFNPDGADSPQSQGLKQQAQSDKSKDEEEEEDKKSGGSNESMKQMILNELKNNLLAPFQSIYQKEENLQIDSNFRSLNNVKWFIRVLFLTVIPLNIILYFTGANVSFSELDESINDIFLNEDLRKDYIRAHDAIITMILNNTGALDNLEDVTPADITALVEADLITLSDSYTNILAGNHLNEWTSVLYDYIPKIKDTTTVDYEGIFSDLVIDAENSIQKLTNSLSEIALFGPSDWVDTNDELQFYRANSFEKFNTFLTSVTSEIFRSLESSFSSTEDLSLYILIVEVVIFLLSLMAISRLIFLVIQSLKEILTTFTAIENPYLRETQRYYSRLRDYLEASKSQYISEEIEGNFFKKSTRDLGNRQNENQETRYQKKFKTIESKNFMRKSTIKILGYYVCSVILSCSLTVIFHFETTHSLNALREALTDSQTFLALNPSYIISLIGLKELLHNKAFYQQFDLPYMNNTIQQLENSLNRTMFKTDLDFVTKLNSFLDGTPCETFRSSMNETEYIDCKELVIGKLSTGLITFHNHYGYLVTDTLQLETDERFGEVDMSKVYEFGQLIKVIDNVFMEETLKFWKDNMESYLRSKERLLIILIIVISVLNVLVFIGAEYGVVGTLNERFLLYRKIFNKYMLGDVLIREKRIKSRLVKYKLLNK